MLKGQKYISQIVESLKALDPYLVLLFGSNATGNATEESDIDILVVTKDNFIPKTFSQHNEIYL